MDPRFRISSNRNVALAVGICAALLAAMFVISLELGAGFSLVGPILVLAGIAVIGGIGAYLSSGNSVLPRTDRLAADGNRVATGGSWVIADPSQLIVEPNRSQRIDVAYVPDRDFTAAAVRAVVRATETWWTNQDSAETPGSSHPERVKNTRTIEEVPVQVSGPTEYRAGRRVDWGLELDLDGLAPSSCGDPEVLACSWELAVSIDRPMGADVRLAQPILVTQPRDRVNAGLMDEPLLSLYEEAVMVEGALQVAFRVRPAPLDLAAPASVDLVVTNGGSPITGRAIRLEIYARTKVTVAKGASGEVTIWQAAHDISTLPAGETDLHFDVPAINLPRPDMDLPHGWTRGAMRLVIDIAGMPDKRLSRDLALCLNKLQPVVTSSAP